MKKLSLLLIFAMLLSLTALCGCGQEETAANVADLDFPVLTDTRPEEPKENTFTTLNGDQVTYNMNTRKIVCIFGSQDVVAFGIKLLENQPDAWINNIDTRLKATMMLPGFTWDYLWQDHGGLDFLRFLYDDTYNAAATGTLQAPTGANCVKHLYGNTADHVAALNIAPARMSYALATHILRLSDVYLIYAEAMLGAGRSTSTNASVLDAFYAVHHRAVPSSNYPTSVSWNDIWKERRYYTDPADMTYTG